MQTLSLPTLQADSAKDFAITESGDLAIDSTGDFAMTTGISVLQQEIAFRLKTKLGDYAYSPGCGTRLEELIGMPNSQQTADLGESYIKQALTHDGLLLVGSLEIYSWPSEDTKSIVFNILIDLSPYGYPTEEFISFPITLDLKEGLVF